MWRICSPCNLTEATFAVLSTHRSTATAAPQDGVWTGGWGLAHRWLVGMAEWTAVCRLEQEPSLSELLKASFWDCTLQMRSYSHVSHYLIHFVNKSDIFYCYCSYRFVPFYEQICLKWSRSWLIQVRAPKSTVCLWAHNPLHPRKPNISSNKAAYASNTPLRQHPWKSVP